MSKTEKFIIKLLAGTSDSNMRFDDLINLLIQLGFDERIKGSHHIFRKLGIEEKINLQVDGAKAKPYQVRQVRGTLIKYKMLGDSK